MKTYSDLDPRNDMQPHLPRVLNRDVYYKGHTIIEQGADGNRAFYIEKGQVEVLVRDGHHEVRVAILGPGEIFGEMALIEHEDRSATARAYTDATVTVISAHDLEDKISHIEDKAVAALIHQFINRLRASNEGQLEHYKNFAEFQDRVAGLVEKTARGVNYRDRQKFRDEVGPLLNHLDELLQKYGKKQKSPHS
ncbi:MAG: cyclic nucleotide-binding domain-containing protein [Alphaproteobacteria bacterium]|nr:cyclic nucleotide-binding domain-containing protein [Alphaproteobacteria bacterium]